jgi:hypothetical protein
MTDCEGGKLDSVTNLCWENPPSTGGFNWNEALTYCDDLTVGGHDDWRLPMIQELISLLRGCVSGTTTGDLSRSQCGVIEPGCLDYDECWDARCGYCEYEGGSDDESDGCYWDPALAGICGDYWSSSSGADNWLYGWDVRFGYGYVGGDDKPYGHRT